MRIVSILILLTVAAAVYVANFIAVDDSVAGPDAGPAVVAPADVAAADASKSGDGPGLSEAEADLPEAFPSELTRRSRAGAAQPEAASSQASSSEEAPSESTGKSAGRIAGPTLRQPRIEVDPETETRPQERLSGAPTETAANPRRRPAREIKMPESPAPVAAEDIPVTDIVLPTTPGDVRVMEEAPGAAEQEAASVEIEAAAAGQTQSDSDASSSTAPADSSTPPAEPASVASQEPTAPASEDVSPEAMPSDALKSLTLRGSVMDTSGKALSSVAIDVVRLSSGDSVRSLRSDVSGAFSADGFSAGRYALRVDPASVPLGIASPIETENCRTGSEPAGYGTTCVDLRASNSVAAKIELPLSSGIQGTVLGAAGGPQKGAIVRAVSQVTGFEGHAVITKTDGEGFFFLGLVPGPYELQMVLPGDGKPEDLTRRMEVTAKPGSALLLDAVDFSKKSEPGDAMEDSVSSSDAPLSGAIPLNSLEIGLAEASSTARADSGMTLAAVPLFGAVGTAEEVEEGGVIELRGRVISKWGEALPALSVIAETLDGEIIEATQTSDAGQYILEEIPVGRAIIRVASDLDLNREGPRGTTLLKRPEPVFVQTFPGQKRVSVEDVVVEVRRMYRLQGRIQIDPKALEEFKKGVNLVRDGADPLSDKLYRRAYYRGMRLTQRNKGKGDGVGQRKGQSIQIESDGSFVWQCTLPADDILLVLEPRTTRKDIGYRGAIGIPVTPAGVRPATLEVPYPPAAAKDPAPEEDTSAGDLDLAGDASAREEASAHAEVGPIASTR